MENDDERGTVTAEDWNEDDELQARIWYSFFRKDRG